MIEVYIIRRDIPDALMVATGVIPINKPPDFLLRLPILEQDTLFRRAVESFDLTIALRKIR